MSLHQVMWMQYMKKPTSNKFNLGWNRFTVPFSFSNKQRDWILKNLSSNFLSAIRFRSKLWPPKINLLYEISQKNPVFFTHLLKVIPIIKQISIIRTSNNFILTFNINLAKLKTCFSKLIFSVCDNWKEWALSYD